MLTRSSSRCATGNAPISGAGTGTAAFIGCFSFAGEASSSSSATPAGSSTSSASAGSSSSSSSRSSSSSAAGGSSSSSAAPLRAVPAGTVVLCINHTDFVNNFTDPNYPTVDGGFGQFYLEQAVYGFFQNGGTECHVVRVDGRNTGDWTGTWLPTDFHNALTSLEPITGISQVAAPGMTRADAVSDMQNHCEVVTNDRFAILETPNVPLDASFVPHTYANLQYTLSDYSGLYFPWIMVPDPRSTTGALIAVPPSGHIAGVYARVDANRGVNKAPANEVLMGALGFTQLISQRQQNVLNANNVNCLRNLNGKFLIWGARTLVDPRSPTLPQIKYVNARRLLNYLKDSLYNGLEWTVFEPNASSLWATVTQEVSAFLEGIWQQGALLGDTPAAAYYVRCNSENNPNPQAGSLFVEIGVAIVEPAEYVQIFLNDWAGPPQA